MRFALHAHGSLHGHDSGISDAALLQDTFTSSGRLAGF